MTTRSLVSRLGSIYPQSLTAEITRLFGIEKAVNFLTVFAGTTIHVPSTLELENEERNLAIYDTLKESQSGAESRRLGTHLCQRYKLKRKELRKIYKQTRAKLKAAEKHREKDKLVAEYRRK